MKTPRLETERLILRLPSEDDTPAYVAFYADAEASSFYGGPLGPVAAWSRMARDVGHWHLRGYGMFSVIERESGKMVGGCGLYWPTGWPRPELTWWIPPEARRKGYAHEASRAVIDWGYDDLGWDLVETHADDHNRAAHGLIRALGGIEIAREVFPDGVERSVFRLPKGD